AFENFDNIDGHQTHCFNVLEAFVLGLGVYEEPRCEADSYRGYVAFPGPRGGTDIKDNDRLVSTGTDRYLVFPVSGAAWVSRALLPLYAPPLNAGPTEIGKDVKLEYNTMDQVGTLLVREAQTLRFNPLIDVTLTFPGPLDYVVHKPNGDVLKQGRDSAVTFPLGDSIDLTVPSDQQTPLS